MVFGEEDKGVFLGVEFNSALQSDGAGHPIARGYDNTTATLAAHGGDGIVNGFGIQRLAVGYGTEVGYRHCVSGEMGLLYFFHLKRQALIDRCRQGITRLGVQRPCQADREEEENSW